MERAGGEAAGSSPFITPPPFTLARAVNLKPPTLTPLPSLPPSPPIQKLCVRDPGLFVRYFNNSVFTAACRSWLGPDFQVTSQVNSSHPGSSAQDPHCDYHLGFRTNEQVTEYPSHVHKMSQYLTLQGAIAHVDMPLETGPTTFLPYSQNFERNYLTWRDPKFVEYYRQR